MNTRTILTAALMALAATATPAGKRTRKAVHRPMPDQAVLSIMPEALPTPSAEPLFAPQQPSVDAPAAAPPSFFDDRIKGIDVSHHQGHIDWTRVAADPQVNYCFIKATESVNFVDKDYYTNLRRARAAGIKVGAYHFFSHRTSPMQQLQNMASVVKLEDQDIIPLIDVETIHRRTDVHAFRQRLKTFLRAVEKHYGIRPLIYTGENFYNRYLAGHFTDYRFMIAKYREPAPVLLDKDTQVLMWQYSCTGTIDGVRGNCDQSCFLLDYNINDILIK